KVFGPGNGVALANVTIFLALLAVSIAMLRLRYRGPPVPLLVLAFYLCGFPYLYVFAVHTDLLFALFVAIALYLCLLALRTDKLWVSLAAFAAMGLTLNEKAPALLVFLPIAVVVLLHVSGGRRRLMLPGVALVALLVAAIPSLYYSDGASWNPYGGERYVYHVNT